MTECRSPELQDLLPDFAAEMLDEPTTVQVHTHLSSCAACAEDVALLRVARRIRPQAVSIDVARIVAALPAPPAGAEPSASRGLRLVREASAPAPTTPQSAARQPRVMGLSLWRLAATLGVVIAGGASLVVARQGVVGLDPAVDSTRVTLRAESLAQVAQVPRQAPPESLGQSTAAPREVARPVSVSYGDLGDYTEDELQRMLDRLEQWDGATNEEPLPASPIVSLRGGSL